MGLGIINNRNKNFILQPSIKRDTETLKKLLYEYIKPDITLVHDARAGYNFIRSTNDYIDITHNHVGGDFEYGTTSTSYIESLRHALKSKLLGAYKHIPSKYFVSYMREVEFKIKNGKKNYDQIINEIFDCYFHNNNLIDDIIVEYNEYLSDIDCLKDEIDSD